MRIFNRFIFTFFFICLNLYAGVSKGEITTYKTYSFESEGSEFHLHIATSNGKFLYAGILGGKEMASCTLNNQKLYDAHHNAPRRGKIVCGSFESSFANDLLIKPTYDKKPIKLQQIDSFTTQEVKIEGKTKNGSYSVLLLACGNNKIVNNTIIEASPVNICDEANYDALTKDVEKEHTYIVSDKGGDDISAWEIVYNTRISYFDADSIVLELITYEYFGGAHGSTDKLYMAFDRKSGERIMLGHFTEQDNELIDLLWDKLQAFATEHKAELLISKDEFRVSRYVTPSYDGLDYIYPPYSVLPYSYGFITLTLSRDEVDFIHGG